MRHSQLQSLLHKATSVPSPRRFPQQHFIPVLPRAPRANLCLFVFFREIFGNSGRELWEKGGLGHFLVTRPFCSGLLTNNSPEQPLLRNQVTVQQPAPIPCWTVGKAVCNTVKSLPSPQPEEPRCGTTHLQVPVAAHIHPARSRLHSLHEAAPHFYCRALLPGFLMARNLVSGHKDSLLLSSTEGPTGCLSPSRPEASLPAATAGSKGRRVTEHQLPGWSPAGLSTHQWPW